MPGKYGIARRINQDLFMWSERFVDPDTAGAHYFDEVWGDSTGSMIQMYPPEWNWSRPAKDLLVVEITAEWCGAYCEGGTGHYHYDLRDGSRVYFDSLFTKDELEQVKRLVGERWRVVIGKHLAALQDSSQRLPTEASSDWWIGAIELYEQCLQERANEDPYVGDMVITRESVSALVSRCSVHADMALDDLMDVEVPLSREELAPWMRPAALKWLGW